MAKNEVGVVADISRALADNGINIETINAEAIGDNGAISLTTDDYDGALRALTSAGFKTVTDDSLIVNLRDEPGALAKVAEKLKQGGVNIQRESSSIVAIEPDRPGRQGIERRCSNRRIAVGVRGPCGMCQQLSRAHSP